MFESLKLESFGRLMKMWLRTVRLFLGLDIERPCQARRPNFTMLARWRRYHLFSILSDTPQGPSGVTVFVKHGFS